MIQQRELNSLNSMVEWLFYMQCVVGSSPAESMRRSERNSALAV